jgi:hypothetical protein
MVGGDKMKNYTQWQVLKVFNKRSPIFNQTNGKKNPKSLKNSKNEKQK